MFAFFLCFCLAFSSPVLGRSDGSTGLTDRETWLLYREFKEIRSVGIIAVSLVGDAAKIGLDARLLTDYAKARFKHHFTGVLFEDITRDSDKFFALIASRDKKVGNITIRVWVIGDEYPVVYHIKCDAGNFDNPSIWNEEILGHGSKKTAPEAIERIIDEMLETLAGTYFRIKAQGM